MKKSIGLALVLVLLVASVALAESYPQIVGVWEGTTTGYNPDKGFVENTLILEVQEQKDGAFYGVKSLKLLVNGKEVDEKVCGTVTSNGRILLTEFGDGYMSGDIDGDTMILQYVEAGPKAKAFIHEFKRKK
jgi:hypothetical protein